MSLGNEPDVAGTQDAFPFNVELPLFHDVEGVRGVNVTVKPGVWREGIFKNRWSPADYADVDFALDVIV